MSTPRRLPSILAALSMAFAMLPLPAATAAAEAWPDAAFVTLAMAVAPGGLAPIADMRMTKIKVIRGDINPKSIVSSQHGLFFAQNVFYRHSTTVYDRDFELVKTIRDRVTLSDYGYPRWDEPVRGGPVQAVFTADGEYAYVSQYSMYGPGFNHPR